ncbi:hypothetical protein RJ639_035557 [Escallonia herrerae]|uniref:MADS-box domain-containing protein n=1 Tax=Escallonia herrerae TaxID=1293975 RepID=A0AA88WP72_9ASTE|nr:hypothetical protein RJ639_035557 [Escallonia herrerae]
MTVIRNFQTSKQYLANPIALQHSNHDPTNEAGSSQLVVTPIAKLSEKTTMGTNVQNFVFKKADGKKRLKSMEKKIRELTILCDIEACLVCFDESDGVSLPSSCYSWPQDSNACVSLIERYYKKVSRRPEGGKRSLPNTSTGLTGLPEAEMGSSTDENGDGDGGEPAVSDEVQDLLQRIDGKKAAVEQRIQLLNAAEEAEDREKKTLWLFRT